MDELERRRIARNLEQDLAGLFGITLEDIEKALVRLENGELSDSLPPNIKRVLLHLDAIAAIHQDSNSSEKKRIAELVKRSLESL